MLLRNGLCRRCALAVVQLASARWSSRYRRCDARRSAATVGSCGSGWFGSLRWRYFGPRPLIEDNSVRSKSTALVNARAGYAFSRTFKLQLDVFNLFNTQRPIDYDPDTQTSFPVLNPDFGQPSRTNLAQLQTPRQVRFGVRYEF